MPEKTARKYPCGCLVRSVSPVVDMRVCLKHHARLTSNPLKTYEQAKAFVRSLGRRYELVEPPRPYTIRQVTISQKVG